MSSTPPPGQARRQHVIDVLCEAFARDEMALEDFERRVETAHRAGSVAELDALLSDLPSAPPPARPGAVPPTGAPYDAPLGISPPGQRTPASTPSRGNEVVVGIMGGAARRGRWTAARRITAIGVMGGVELDFREAILQPGVTEVHAFAFWGGVEILAPPNVRLECSGIGIMGGFDGGSNMGSGGGDLGDPLTPILRVTGVAVMGGVEVAVRYPGESGREAKKRLRADRERRKLGGGDRG